MFCFFCFFKVAGDTCNFSWKHENEHCYRLFKIKNPWPEALRRCQDLNSTLVEIENQAENDFVRGKMLSFNIKHFFFRKKYNCFKGIQHSLKSYEHVIFLEIVLVPLKRNCTFHLTE